MSSAKLEFQSLIILTSRITDDVYFVSTASTPSYQISHIDFHVTIPGPHIIYLASHHDIICVLGLVDII